MLQHETNLLSIYYWKTQKEKVASSLLFPALGEKKKENIKILISLHTINFLWPKSNIFILTVITFHSEIVNNFVDCCSVSEHSLYTCLLYRDILFYFLFFYFTLFYFTILYSFCHTSTWMHHGCIRVPNPEPPSHLPPSAISLGHPSAPAPSILYPASNLDWQFISYMILYMFQCQRLF